ncbi:MAG: hypothetical protein QM709_03185 [Spongiibacteraceae bacterium]
MEASQREDLEYRMKYRAEMHVLNGARWLTTSQISEMMMCTNPNRLLDEWKSSGRIFSIEHNGIEYFPAYGLDSGATCHPLQVIAKLITIFQARKTSWDIAIWCQFPNSFLAGKRPKDVLAVDPESVVDAARHEAAGVLHG